MAVRILPGDCRDVLKTLADGSVHCVVTSPPYFGLRDYGVVGQMGSEPSLAAYIAGMVEVFREVRRVLRDDGTVWLNMGDAYSNDAKWGGSTGGKHVGGKEGNEGYRLKRVTGLKPKDLMMVPARLAIALQDDGWYLRSDVIWSKPNPMPESVRDRPTTAHEHIFLLTKRPSYFYDATAIEEAADFADSGRQSKVRGEFGGKGGAEPGREPFRAIVGRRNKRTVWHVATEPFPESHFAVMPTAIVEPCILAGTSERGCCPACGAPWARIIERESRQNWDAGDGQKHDGTYYRPNIGGGVGNDARAKVNRGWSPTCSCDGGDPLPCIVLDPFFGAGTVGLVADRLGRDCIGIELNPEYADMAARRLHKDAGMFAEVSR